MIDYAKEIAKDKSKKIIFFVDVAYIDFVKDDIASRKFFKKFGFMNVVSKIEQIS